MENAYTLSTKILKDINEYHEKYVSEDGKDVKTQESIMTLNYIIESGFALHKYIVEKELYKERPLIEIPLLEVQKYLEQLQINKENADKLRLSNVIQLWNQTKIAIAMLACGVLDFKDSLS